MPLGNKIGLTLFGASHEKEIGAVLTNLPEGETIDLSLVSSFLFRRAPGRFPWSSSRKEPDEVKILSGLADGKTDGAPLRLVIENKDAHSADYADFSRFPRPGHADYPALVKSEGKADLRGGGVYSGRMTAPLCAAGAIASQILARRSVYAGAHIASLMHLCDASFPLFPSPSLFHEIASKDFPVLSDPIGKEMISSVLRAAEEGDSLGGSVECALIGLPAGIGETLFESWESRLSAALFAIPAVKGIEFGDGFSLCSKKGSEANDAYRFENDRVTCPTNHNGGILGGLTNGMPILFRVAVKPTPSIMLEQKTVDLAEKKNADIRIKGRHDPCILPRVVPAVEAAALLTALDILSEGGIIG